LCGKLIVAANSEEAARLDDLLARGLANGLVGLRLLSREEMLEIEPHVGGVRALHVPSTGITDYAMVTAKYAEIAVGCGAEVKTNAGVVGFDRSQSAVVVKTRAGEFSARYVVNCAGLYSDHVARMAGDADLVIIFGASAITDRRDVIPAALVAAGGRVLHLGMPVDPGNLLLLGEFGAVPVIGAPGCARSPRENGFDFVLRRFLAGLTVTGPDLRAMGAGGLLQEIASRPQPRNPQNAGR